MSKKKMDLAPHIKTERMIFDSYNHLGIISNQNTKFLRKKGFAAQACHPLGGVVNYPLLAEQAKIGWLGRHGLSTIPEYGQFLFITIII